MPKNVIHCLIRGYKRFYQRYFKNLQNPYPRLIENGQHPQTLMIACSDSRVDPAILFDTDPGDLFVIRNVANLVPPFEPTGDSHHGTSAALEFGVNHLHVKTIVVLGHSQCGGIKTLCASCAQAHATTDQAFSFIKDWVSIAIHAQKSADQQTHLTPAEKLEYCEKEAIKISLNNLLTFPWIAEKVQQGSLKLEGWYFSLDGHLSVWNPSEGRFCDVNEAHL